MLRLKNFLIAALDGKLQLHESISQDIGYLYNQELQNKSGLFFIQLDNRDFWIGRDYLLWAFEYMATWIYNAPNGDIVFAVTPLYQGSFLSTQKTMMSYAKWMKTYKPHLMVILSRKIVQRWLAQTNSILEQIDKNNPHM